MELDRDQLAAVRMRRNVVVSAGAGSGKTSVLTERFVDLVLSGAARVPEILALTFTRKAATEMFGRIHAALLDRVRTQPEIESALVAFDEAQISTIDSFCAMVLRDGATGLGLPSVFEVAEKGVHRSNEIAAARFLAEHSEHPILARFVRHYGIDSVLENLLIPFLDRHARLSRPIDFVELNHRRARWLSERLAETERLIDVEVAGALASPPEDSYFSEIHETLGRCVGDYAAIGALLGRVDFRKGKRNAETTAFKALLRERLLDKRNGLLERRTAYRETLDTEGDARALHELLAGWQEVVLADRRRSGSLGYQEIMELAVEALRTFPDLLSSYRRRFRYIMIDEFQDNNRAQRDLLFLLAGDPERAGSDVPTPDELDPSKLFFVGDQKQSIYRFRGADVRVFKHLAEEIGHSVALVHNYRSEPKLIEFFNRFFPRVFAGAEEEYEAAFEALQHRDTPRNDDRCAITVARVAVNPIEGDWAENTYAEGEWIAEEIISLVADHGYRGEEIAILLRSSGKQQHYERMLRRHGIPYQTQILRSLFLEAPAADLYALLQLHYYPRDRSAYATVLRSPFVMASDDALWRVMKAGHHEPFAAIEGLLQRDRDRFVVGRDLLSILDRSLDRRPLYLVLEDLWKRSGYRYAILSRASDHGYLEHFDYLLTIAQSYEERPAIEFVEFLRRELGRSEKIDEIDAPRRAGAVQIMTIHKAKGLEFPVVFVADCDSRPAADRSILSVHDDIGLTIRIPPAEPGDSAHNVFASHADEEERAQEVAERKRLLYVAATRAETRLYFTASLRERKRSEGESLWEMISSATGLTDDTLRPTVEFDQYVEVREIGPLAEERLRDRVSGSSRKARSEWAGLPDEVEVVDYRPIAIETSPTAINEALMIARGTWEGNVGDDTGDAPARGDARALGSLTHTLLELRMREGMTRERWLAVPFEVESTIGDVENGRELLEEAWELSESFIGSELRARLAALDLRFEQPFLFALGEGGVRRYVRGQFDLVALGPDVVHVVDFKTDRAIDAAHYDGQMAIYIEAARALHALPVELSLFALRDARAIPTAPDLDAVLAEILASVEARKTLGWDLSPDGALI